MLADGYATYALDAGRPGGVTAAWLSAWVLMPPLFGAPPLLFPLFPGGRPLTPRWRWVVRFTVVAIALQTVGTALLPGELLDAPVDGLANPAGVAGEDVVEGLGWGFGLTGLELAYMNSGGIGLLVTLLVRVNRHSQTMLAYGLSEHYRQIFELTRLDEAVGIHDSEHEALAAAGAA